MLDYEIVSLILNDDKRGMVELKKKYHNTILDMIKSILKDEKYIESVILVNSVNK